MRVLTNVYSKPGSWHVNVQVSKLLMSFKLLTFISGEVLPDFKKERSHTRKKGALFSSMCVFE